MTASPIALLVDNLCHLNNGAMEQIADFVAAQPPHVRARLIERCASLIGSVAERDAAEPAESLTPITTGKPA